jgi:hypothetical protein
MVIDTMRRESSPTRPLRLHVCLSRDFIYFVCACNKRRYYNKDHTGSPTRVLYARARVREIWKRASFVIVRGGDRVGSLVKSTFCVRAGRKRRRHADARKNDTHFCTATDDSKKCCGSVLGLSGRRARDHDSPTDDAVQSIRKGPVDNAWS